MVKAIPLLLGMAVVLLVGAVNAQPAGKGKLRVLVVTGGHPFERPEFFTLFEGYDDIEYKEAQLPGGLDLLNPEAGKNYEVVVLYDMWQEINDQQKQGFLDLVKGGKGVVALHHCLGSYQNWDEYHKLIGGRWNAAARTVDGKQIPASGFHGGLKIPVKIADTNHPITRGLSDFEIEDETYSNFEVDEGVHVLLTTTQPESGPKLGWCKTYGKARVAYLQGGHGGTAYSNPNYRRLVVQAIRWAAHR